MELGVLGLTVHPKIMQVRSYDSPLARLTFEQLSMEAPLIILSAKPVFTFSLNIKEEE